MNWRAEQAGTWDSLKEGGGRVEDAEGTREHAAAFGQRHQPHENAVARGPLLRLGRARHTQVPAQHLCVAVILTHAI